MRFHFSLPTACLPGLLLPVTCAGALRTAPWEEPSRGLPLIAAYDVPATRHNGEVWGFAPAEAGQLWVGSDELFLFNGETREKITLPFDAYAVRALAHDVSGKLWVGAIGEIGHLERNATGEWRYQSSLAALKAAGINEVRVWEALSTSGGVVFVTDDHVLRWDGTRFQQWAMPSSGRLRPTRDRDTLWIFQPGAGLFRMEEGGPRLVISAAELPDASVSWAIGVPLGDDTMHREPLIVGGLEGVYRREGRGWVKLGRLSAAIAGKSSWRALRLDEHTVAIGTVLGGVIIGTTDDRVLAVLDRASGLPNESVTSLWLDERSHHLWIGYVGGMSRVEASGAMSVFDARNGLKDTPALKTVQHDGHTYILARRALSVLAAGSNGQPATVGQLARLPTPLSDALSNGPNLWLSGLAGGLWRVDGDKVRQEAPIAGFVFALADAQEPSTELFYLENTQVRALILGAEGGWTPQSLDADVGAYAISAVRDGAGDLWISTVTRGLFRFRVEGAPTGPRLALRRHYRAGDGLPAEDVKRPVLTTLGGRVYTLSEQSILGYDARLDGFVPSPGLDQFVALAGTPANDPAVAYWIVRNPDIESSAQGAPALIRLRVSGTDTTPVWEPLDVPLDPAGRISGLSFTDGAAPTLWVTGSQALLRLSIDAIEAPPALPPVMLRGIHVNGASVDLPAPETTLHLGAESTQLRFTLDGVKRAEGRPLLVQAALRGLSDEWTRPRSDAAFEFTGLRPGNYVFQARVVDRFGRFGPVFTLSFALPPAWYRSAPAMWAYILSGLLVIVAVVRWRLRQLHRLNARLNRLVDERTAELARANIARNEFLEAISHEIRNPLNGITNLVDLLHDAKLNPEAQKLAESLGRSAAHLKQVFGDVLGYTKLEYGHVGVSSIPFSLRQLLDDTLALFAVQAREQRNELHVILSPDFRDGFHGDADKIQTVVSNFISNALKYAPAVPVEIIVRTTPHPTEEDINLIWLGVRDHGPGLSAEEQEKLFRKFARGQSAKTRRISGTGLGLAICRRVADLLDGRVGIASTEGQGSTFWLEIPLAQAALPVAAPAETPAVTPQAGGALALIVDDQEYNQAVLRGIAQRLGYRAEVAACAEDVWPLVERLAFAVVFLDWELPGLNGGDIARRLRTHLHAHDAVIIATTAHDSEDIVQQCLAAGMDAFAAKPFDTAAMRTIVSDALARRGGRATRFNATRIGSHPGTSALPSLTLTAFTDFAAGDPAHARQAVSLYLDTLDQEVAALTAAIVAQDREAMARRAHRLRSHAGLVNGVALNTAAQRLMQAARHGEPDVWRTCIQPVLDEAAALKSAIHLLATESTRDPKSS